MIYCIVNDDWSFYEGGTLGREMCRVGRWSGSSGAAIRP